MGKLFKLSLKIVFSCVLVYSIYYIWANQEKLITLAYNTFKSEKIVEIKEANNYKRYYLFDSYNTNENFEPLNYMDLKNIVYNFLNNGWDEFTFYCTTEYPNCVEDVKVLSSDASLLSSINNYVNPFNSFDNIYTKISSDGSVNLKISKTYPDEFIVKINEKIDEIIIDLKLDSYNDWNKIKKVHNYLINHISYDKRDNYKIFDSNTAYGALLRGTAICSGYADSMALFLDRLNIPNFKIASDNHVWNMVLINDNWLHVDVTWNDPINAVAGYNKYAYFLIDTNKLLKLDKTEHTFNEEHYQEIKKAN